MWPWCAKMPTQNLLRLLLLLMIVMRIVLATVLQIWKLRFGHKAQLLFRLSAQGLVKSLKLKFRQDFETEILSVFCCWCWWWETFTTVVCRFVSWSLVMRLNFVQTLSSRFGQEFEVEVQAKFWNWSLVSILLLRLGEVMKWMFGQDFDVKVWSKDFEFWNLIKICVRTCFFGKQNSTLGSVVPLAMLVLTADPATSYFSNTIRRNFCHESLIW